MIESKRTEGSPQWPEHTLPAMADVFISSRTDEGGRAYGTLTAPALQQGMLNRVWPE